MLGTLISFNMKLLNIILCLILVIGMNSILNYPITFMRQPVGIEPLIAAFDLLFNQIVIAYTVSKFWTWFNSNIKEKV